jgi:hypothetical protein
MSYQPLPARAADAWTPAFERVKKSARIGHEVLQGYGACFETRPRALLSMR